MCKAQENMWRTKMHGFTLFETLIVVSIVSIMVAFSWPSYTRYLLKSHRADALTALSLDQTILERCYAQTFSYNGDCPELANYPHHSAQGYYIIALSNLTSETYQLTAKPTSSQSADKACSTLTLDQANRKGAMDSSGMSQPACWVM